MTRPRPSSREFTRFLGIPAIRITDWTAGHGAPHWANLTGVPLVILDWEGWGPCLSTTTSAPCTRTARPLRRPPPVPLAARAEAALSDPAWQVRAGATIALLLAAPGLAVPALAKALTDRNADVRKAAVTALAQHRATGDARAALATATTDPDADVRACAARPL
ncbi:hypothetical protein GCM10010271_06980 [Streptomyces kurssanovii]|nr:hypothetical protein GCM10010271_06980 [Streptomyces kurssanovii]